MLLKSFFSLRMTALCGAAALLVVACATSPTGRSQLRLVSDDEMSAMGITAYRDMQQKQPRSQDAVKSRYVQCVASALTAQVPGRTQWEVTLFDSKDVNAFALPGGKIGVYTGLLKVATTQDQLAAVLGHEVSHVLAGHSASRVSNQMATQLGVGVLSAASGMDANMIGMGAQLLVLLPFSRGDESEADVLGLDLMAKAGFNPEGAVTLWQNMARAGGEKPPEILSTHPSDSTRINGLRSRLPQVDPLYQQARARGLKPNCGA
jgi:predicted Zn-dependent protease